MNEQEMRLRLRQWDPAADAETPSAELQAHLRAELAARAPAPTTPAGARLGGRWAVAALSATAVLLAALFLARVERRPPGDERTAGLETAAAPAAEVQVVYTASNGVRIYWSVPAAAASKL